MKYTAGMLASIGVGCAAAGFLVTASLWAAVGPHHHQPTLVYKEAAPVSTSAQPTRTAPARPTVTHTATPAPSVTHTAAPKAAAPAPQSPAGDPVTTTPPAPQPSATVTLSAQPGTTGDDGVLRPPPPATPSIAPVR